MMRNICILVSLLILHPVCGQLLDLTLWNFSYYTNMYHWSQAQSFCRQNNMDLVSIENEQDQDVLSGKGWIGLYRDNKTDPWKWSRGDKIATFFRWAPGEPNNNDIEHCAFTYSDTQWLNGRCVDKHPFMCSDEKLVLVKENKTWQEALEHCRSLGGVNSGTNIYNLATLKTQDDHNYAQERAQQANTDEVWTGLRYLDDEWFWMGGEPVQYQDIPSCPAVRCGVLEKSGTTLFGIRDCSQRNNFFCYKKI